MDGAMSGKKRSGGTQPDGCYGDERQVFNFNGTLLIDLEGRVIALAFDEKIEPSGMMESAVLRSSHFRQIVRVDLDEWEKFWDKDAAMELHILDVGYWYDLPDQAGDAYQPADPDWRAEQKRFQIERQRTGGV